MLREWLADYVCQLKFVVAEQQDIEEIKDILHQLNVSIPSETVLLMPEAATLKKMNQLNDLLIRACKEYGFRYCRRVQIDVFGSQKGK
jgi:7-carboxy-7-deazaguanine synthase